MPLAEIAIATGGALTLAVSIGHTFFHRLFRWGPELERVSLMNRRILYTIHVALYLLALPMAFVSLRFPGELARGRGLGGALALSLAAFWLWRLVWQLAYFGPLVATVSAGWRRFHRALVLLFLVQVAAYGGPVAAAWLSRA